MIPSFQMSPILHIDQSEIIMWGGGGANDK